MQNNQSLPNSTNEQPTSPGPNAGSEPLAPAKEQEPVETTQTHLNEFQKNAERGEQMLGEFMEGWATKVWETNKKLEEVINELRKRQSDAAAGREPAMDAVELASYKVLISALKEQAKNQSMVLSISSKIDYKRGRSGIVKQEA